MTIGLLRLTRWRAEHQPASATGDVYAAFISYSHAADGRLAPALQRGLHRFTRPAFRLRALRVFRDEASLSANPGLWSAIEQALGNAEFSILLASPEAARSPWVGREVAYWVEHKSPATMLIVLTDGDLAWNDGIGDFDWSRTTALPSSLRGIFGEEPRYIDLRWARGEQDVSLHNPHFRNAIADLAAPLHHRPKDELIGEDVHQHRLTTRLHNGAIAVLAALTILSLVLGLLARENAREAELALYRAVSRELATKSQVVGDTEPVVSKLLSVAAWRLNPSLKSRAAMVAAMNRPGIALVPRGGGPVEFSPDRRTMATGGPGTVVLWSSISHEPIGAPLTGHQGFVGRLAFSPDGNLLATGSDDGTVRLWDVASHGQIGEPLNSNGGTILAVTFSPDGDILATGSDDGTVRLWDVASHRQIGNPIMSYSTSNVTFSPDGRALAFFGSDGSLQLWDITTNMPAGKPLTGFVGAIVGVAFSPNGRMLAAGGADGVVRVWDVASQSLVAQPLTGFTGGIEGLGVNAVAFSADGDTLTATGWDGTVRSWDVTSGAQIGDALVGGAGIRWASFSADRDTVAASSEDGAVRLWDLTNRNHRGTPLSNGGGRGFSASISPDGRILAVGETDGTVRLWNTDSRTQIGTPMVDPASATITAVVFSPDGQTLAVGGNSSPVRLWNVRSRTPIGEAIAGSGELVGFGPDGHTLVTAGISEGVEIWNLATRARITQFRPDEGGHFASVAVSRDGQLLAAGSYDGKVQLWDLHTYEQIGDPLNADAESISAMGFSPDRRILVTGGNYGTLKLWDLHDRHLLGDPVLGFPGAQIQVVAFSPDGTTLAASAENGSARLWDAATQMPLGAALERYSETIQSIAFSPDGRTLVTSTGVSNPAVRLWNAPPATQIDDVLCIRVGRSLTPDNWKRYVPELPFRQIC